MKKAELSVGRHVWVGGRYGDEGWILDAEADWDINKWAPRGQGRFRKGSGKRVAVAQRQRFSADSTVHWGPNVVVLGQIRDYEEHHAEIQQERQATQASRARERQLFQERENRKSDWNRRLSEVLDAPGGFWLQVDHGGVKMSEKAFEGLLRAAERKQ